MELLGSDATTQQTFQLLLVISLLTFPFKGLALWKASQLKQKGWFIILLLINTLGILDIIYYFFVDQEKPKKQHKTN